MANNDSAEPQESYNVGEQPGNILRSSDESYRVLIAALDLGWQVAEPVYLCPRWDEGSKTVYHFILTKSCTHEPNLITPRFTQDIERLILEDGWQVN